jgi:Ca-activated chloride channel family protein
LRVDVSLPGFKSLQRFVTLRAGETLNVDAVLEVGSLSETVIVTSASPRIETAAAKRPPRWTRPGYAGGYVRPQNEADDVMGRRISRNDKPRFQTEAYDEILDNPFVRVTQDPRATFSIDVDTASYANVRRFLNDGRLPPKDSVRIEEMVNYFRYHYPRPVDRDPVTIQIDSAPSPWSPEHRLVRIALKAKEVDLTRRPPSNLVFLIDVSGSMEPANKLPLLKSALKLLIEKLTEKDRVSIVVYAGASGLALPPTSGSDKEAILNALAGLEARGSTNGASGIQLAYQLARANFVTGGINRVILATDGDFNVGITSQGELIRLIQDKAGTGVFLSVLGFGMGNYKDSMLEKLAGKGNGNYAYIDTLNEARKVLVEQMSGTMMTVAKDVKLQIEFNPVEAEAYRLIGYENRVLKHEDFNDDLKDAGDVGAGHTVTAFFEIIPPGLPVPSGKVDPLKYQTPARPNRAAGSRELLTAKLRYKEPDGTRSRLLAVSFHDTRASLAEADSDFRFAAAVAGLGMILRDSPYKGSSGFDGILELARANIGEDDGGYRREFIQLIEKARAIASTEK